jgi:predicted transcriptional regulator of viral defense system
MSINSWINERERLGIVCFSREEVQHAFPHKDYNVLGSELSRLCVHGILANVYNGFFVKIPARYACNRIVPPEYYIDQLMRYIGRPYYASLLSAAQIFGAGHQAPQRFCVTTTRPVMTTSARKNPSILWLFRREIPQQLLIQRNSETASINYSCAELTAVDLVQYAQYIGGLSRCTTVLSELLESADFAKVDSYLYRFSPLASFQRLGYITEEILGYGDQADTIYRQLREANLNFRWTALSKQKPIERTMTRSSRWKLIVNTTIEVDEL